MDFYSFITWLFRNLWKILSLLSFLIVVIIWQVKPSYWSQVLPLFFNLEGTAFLSAAFSPPIGQMAAKGSLMEFVKDCNMFESTIKFNSIFFFSGIIFLFLANVLTAYIN